MDRVNISKGKTTQPLEMDFEDIPTGPFYGTFAKNETETFLFIKGGSGTMNMNSGQTFTNNAYSNYSFYLYRPVTLDITVKEVA